MADFINLTCPSCGGRLQITNDLDRFACSFCGNELIVRRSGGTVSISPVIEGLKAVQTGVDKTASELAIIRIKKEIESLYYQKSQVRPKDRTNSTMSTIVVIGLAALILVGFRQILLNLIEGKIIDRGLIFSLVIIIAVIIGLIKLYIYLGQEEKIIYQDYLGELEKYQNAIDEKEKALRTHQAIVDGQ